MKVRRLLAAETWLGIGVFVIGMLAGVGQSAEPSQWAQFRGPGGNGISRLNTHPIEWSEDDNIDWKITIAGVAWSQPIVWGDQILLSTAVADDQPRPSVGESGPGFNLFSREGISRSLLGGGDPPDSTYQWRLISVDLKTGARQWEKLVREARPAIPIHRSNSYASETPVTDGNHVYVMIAMVGVYCFDMDGSEVWNKPLNAHTMHFGWGTGSSPLLHGDTLYLLSDNEQKSYLVALDKTNGNERWRVEREESSNWSTPYLWRNKKRVELITCGGKKTRSYDPATGQLLWELNASGRCAMTPVGDNELLYVGSVTRSTGRPGTLTAIRAGAAGNVSKEGANESVAWSLPRTAPELASPLLYEGRLYTLRQHGGIISCIDAASGKRLYRERLPDAGGFTASPWAARGHIFCLDENGTTFVIAAGPELRVVETNKLEGMFWSSAAVADGALLLRSTDHLYRVSDANKPLFDAKER